MVLLAFQAVAVKSNPNDLAPEYAGLLNGLANTAANNAGWVDRAWNSIKQLEFVVLLKIYLDLWQHLWLDFSLIRIVSYIHSDVGVKIKLQSTLQIAVYNGKGNPSPTSL